MTEVKIPQIERPNQVLIKVKRVGICGSDMHIYHGTNPLATYPRVIGHEIAGEVISIGSDVKSIQVGDRVAIEPIRYCRQCYACRKGRTNVCSRLSVLGVHEDGGMQEFLVIDEKQAHKAASSIDWDNLVLAEPYTIGAQAIWRGNVQRGDTVLIQGCGPIGICILEMAKLTGSQVIMTDLNQERLAFALKNGADFVVNVAEEPVLERIFSITDGEGANVVIDAVCLPSTFEISIESASSAGTIVVLGFDEKPSEISQLPITKKELTIAGSRLQTNQFPKVVQLINEKKLANDGLITHKFQLSEIKDAIRFIENNPNEVRKACITFD